MRAIRGNTPPNVSIVHEARLIFPQIPPPTLLDLETLLRMISRRMAKYSLSNVSGFSRMRGIELTAYSSKIVGSSALSVS